MAKLTASQRSNLPSSAFVFPKTRKYPVHTQGHAQHAIRIGSIQYAKGNLTKAQYNQIVKRVNAQYGFKAKMK